MKIAEILKAELSIKNFEFIGIIDKVYVVQDRKGWFFQDVYAKDETGKIKIGLSLGQDNPADNAVPENAIGKQIKAIKCMINEYNGKRSIKTSKIEILSAINPEPLKDKPKENLPQGLVPEYKQKLYSMSIAYAKDLVVANSIKLADMLLYAKIISMFIETGEHTIILDEHGDIRVIK